MIIDAQGPKNESERLRELITELGLPLRRLPEIMSLGYEDCLSWWSQRKEVPVSNRHFHRMMTLLDINEDQLFMGTYDRELARSRLFGPQEPLPERYKKDQNSFLRTSAHIIRYLVLTRGQLFADNILRSLNVSPTIYQNIDTPINLTYFVDLLEILEKQGFSQEELDALGSVMFLSLPETSLGQKFRSCENYFDIYQTLADNFQFFDSNFEYKSDFLGRKYILKTTLPLDHHLDLKNNEAKARRLMRYRHVLLAWFPYLGGLAPVFPKAEMIHSSGTIETHYAFDLA